MTLARADLTARAPGPGDAEYWDFSAPQDMAGTVDLGMAVNASPNLPTWGVYTSSHIHEVAWTGVGSTISAQFLDPGYTGNPGFVTLDILAWP